MSGQHGSEASVVDGGEVIAVVVVAMVYSSQYIAEGTNERSARTDAELANWDVV
jgi:hypothetical protein